MTILSARSDSRLAAKKKPPPPLWPSSIPASAALRKLLGPRNVSGIVPDAPHIGIERVVIVGDVLSSRLVMDALAEHVDQDDVLPIRHPEARRASAVEYGTAGHPLQMPIIVLASDRPGLGHV